MAKFQIINNKSIKFLETYLNNDSPTGFEASGQKIWLDYIKPYIDEQYIDSYGTTVGIINPKAGFKVVIEAHADEISWFVNYITDDGIIYVTRNGGSDHIIAPSKRVKIQTDKGVVHGVFGWPAIHTRRDEKEEEMPKTSNIFIDCGCNSKDEVEKLGVHVGCVITYDAPFLVMNKKKFVGKSLDNKMGGFVIAEVARLIHENKVKLPFGLYVTNSVQEEIGLHGAQMIAHHIKPDIAICTDVTHDTHTPMIKKTIQGDIRTGKGPVLSYGAAVHVKLVKLIEQAAIKNKIDFQRMAVSRSTGTDTDAFAYSNAGVPSALISFPLRYMHTTVEMVDKDDVEGAIQLMFEALKLIKPGMELKYL